MTQLIAPPFKVEFPEQIALSDQIDGTRSDVAASEKAISALYAAVAGSTENLLINPRGVINQASEPDGVIAAGDYFCDGWKAGPAGCEVYRLAGGGFDLRSGSIVQLIPNNLEASRVIRTNFDVVTGSPAIKVNGTLDQAQAGASEYIEIEISGDNSQFNRIVAADSQVKPVYQQSSDELMPCQNFFYDTGLVHGGTFGKSYSTVARYACFMEAVVPINMVSPAISASFFGGDSGSANGVFNVQSYVKGIVTMRNGRSNITKPGDYKYRLILDARP